MTDLACSIEQPPTTRNLQKLERTTLRTSRLLDFCSEKELIAQTGHQTDAWPLVVLKELVDNALDACEEAEVAPVIEVVVDNIELRPVYIHEPTVPVRSRVSRI